MIDTGLLDLAQKHNR